MAKKVLLSMAKEMRQSGEIEASAWRKGEPEEMGGKRKAATRRRGPGQRSPRAPRETTGYWIHGRHAVSAALANPARRIQRFLASAAPDQSLLALLKEHQRPPPEVVAREEIARNLPAGAVHQGLALHCLALEQPSLSRFLADLGEGPATLVALDQVTDPQNVGAILRSAAAFGADALLTTADRAPEEGGTLAKAASGALEIVPYIQETNLARALEQLKEAGFWCLGLDEGGSLLRRANRAERCVLVMGAEGSGLRRLTKAHCDAIQRLPTRPPIAALNVSNAAAVALYELCARS